MAGSKAGGLKSVQKVKAYYGEDHYAKIGKLGGTISRGGGFTNRELARRAGSIGGKVSSRRGMLQPDSYYEKTGKTKREV